MYFSKIVFLLILIAFSKNIYASSWIEGNKLVIQGLDKITARIETSERAPLTPGISSNAVMLLSNN